MKILFSILLSFSTWAVAADLGPGMMAASQCPECEVPQYSDAEVSVLNEGIERTLRREREAQTIAAAIEIKRSGLRYVRDIHDFSRLAVSVFGNPSQGYLEAIGQFTSDHAANYLYSPYELRAYVELESRMTLINQVIAHKTRALPMATDIRDYAVLTDLVFQRPSTAMLEQRSQFLASNARMVRGYESDLYEYFPRLERRMTLVSHAITLRDNLLPLATDVQGFLVMARNHFDSPSSALRSAVSSWIARNIRNVVSYHSDIRTILQIEGQCVLVSEAIAVKEAGLRAVQRPRQFWHLTELAFSNPSQAYRLAVDDFIRRYAGSHGLLAN